MIDQEVAALVEQTAQKFAQQGMDVKSMFTPELVKSLMDSSRDEATTNLRKKLALNALSKSENIEVPDEELEKKLKEVREELAKEKNIDQERLRQAVLNDLLEEKLFEWLDQNNNIEEKKNTIDRNKKTTKVASKEKKVKPKKQKS